MILPLHSFKRNICSNNQAPIDLVVVMKALETTPSNVILRSLEVIIAAGNQPHDLLSVKPTTKRKNVSATPSNFPKCVIQEIPSTRPIGRGLRWTIIPLELPQKRYQYAKVISAVPKRAPPSTPSDQALPSDSKFTVQPSITQTKPPGPTLPRFESCLSIKLTSRVSVLPDIVASKLALVNNPDLSFLLVQASINKIPQ